MLKLIYRIIQISGKYKSRINTAFIFSFLKSMFMNSAIFISFFVITGFLQKTITSKTCLYLAFATVGCVIAQMIFQYISDRLQSSAGFQIFSDMRLKLGTHLRRMPMGYFTEGNIGKISSVLSTDMVFIEENSMTSISDMMNYLFSQLIMAVFMYFIDIRLGLCCTAVILVFLLIGKLLTGDTLKHSSIRQEQNENLTEAVLDFTEGIGIIKTYNLLGDKSKELTKTFEESCDKNIAFEKNHAPWARALNIAYAIGTTAVITVAIFLYINNLIAIEMCLGTLLFAVNLFIPIKSFYANCTRLTVMDSCLDRIEAVFNENELNDTGTEKLPAQTDCPEISFENVTFGYGNKDILKNISFSVEKNKMLALVGPSGGGKSTIANLIARFWDIKSGSIKIKGKDIRSIPLSELTSQISMVFQRVYLFNDTIYNNINMGRPDANENDVINAAKKARCYDFIMSLPNGFVESSQNWSPPPPSLEVFFISTFTIFITAVVLYLRIMLPFSSFSTL